MTRVASPSGAVANGSSVATNRSLDNGSTGTDHRVSTRRDTVKARYRSKSDPIDPAVGQTPWLAWVWLLPVLTIVPYLFGKLHYALPAGQPLVDTSGRPQPSEEIVLSHIQALEDIGFRTVGTHEAILGEEYVLDQVRQLERRCKGGNLVCEVWEQIGSGYHSFTIADHDVLKLYTGVRNIILRVSAKDGIRGPKDAVLLGSHIDSTLPAPGAADDGIGVAVMLDLARVMIDRNEPFNGSVIFVWNGAEETLQDGSHLYATQHETASSVRAVINLEAAGTTGGALLFQATSQEMIEAYSHVPHPRGTSASAEVFSSGIMISDTDFGQFERYLGVSGLDFAIVGHSYFYHTRSDSIKNISPGSAQHFASNIQAVLDHLLGADSPLVSPNEWSPPDIVYVSLFDRVFVSWHMSTADKAYAILASLVVALVTPRCMRQPRATLLALAATPAGMIAGLLAANAVAGVLSFLDLKQTWFLNEHFPLIIYGPVTFLGYLSAQFALSRLISPACRTHLEHAHYHAQLLYPTLITSILQFFRIRSAYIPAFISAILLAGAAGHEVSDWGRPLPRHQVGILWGYAVPLVALLGLGVEAITSTLDIFTPLTGRMGRDAPVEFIIATLASACSFTFLPLAMPLFHRLARRNQRRVLYSLLGISVGSTLLFVSPLVRQYDAMHPKRIALQYSYNHTSHEDSIKVAFFDQGSRLGVIPALYEKYGSPSYPVQHKPPHPYMPDWDVIYPFSGFLESFAFRVEGQPFAWPEVGHEISSTATESGRRIHLKLDFTGLVWPTIAFEAEILDWSFSFPPPAGLKRHHIKVVATELEPIVSLELLVRQHQPVWVDWTAIDAKQMVPGTAPRSPNMPASKVLMELDDWAREKWDGMLDVVCAGGVAGVLEI